MGTITIRDFKNRFILTEDLHPRLITLGNVMELTLERRELIDLASRIPPDNIPAAMTVLRALIVDKNLLAVQAARVESPPKGDY
jgi:hypothetical protein